MSTLRVAIVGGGIGGLAAAAALSRKDIHVVLYEQARRLGEVGAGIGLSRNSIRLMDRLGLGDRIRETSSALAEMRLCDSRGELVSTQPTEGGLRGIYRPDLVEILAESLPSGTVALGRRCVGFNQDDNHATIVFDDGDHAVADVVVAADGIHSSLQHHLVPPGDPVFSGSIAYRGVIPAGRLPEYPSDKATMWMGAGRHFLASPLRSGRLINYAGIVPSDDKMRESWSAPGDPAVLAAEFAGWDPRLQRIISHVDTTFRWASTTVSRSHAGPTDVSRCSATPRTRCCPT